MRLKEILLERNKKAKDLAAEVGTDEPMISKYINYKCLPTPNTMNNICKALECDVKDIYESNEIYIKQNRKKASNELGCYKLTVKLPKDANKILTKKYLQKCGYRNITHWITRCYARLQSQYEIITKKEKAATSSKRNDFPKQR